MMSFYDFAKRIVQGYFLLFFRYKVKGIENIPQEGSALLCANHISNRDPLLVGVASSRKVHFMAKQELFRIPILKQLLPHVGAFPVNRETVGASTIKTTLKLLKSGHVIGIFPEGHRSKTEDLQEMKAGAAFFALKSRSMLVPVGIIGPYRLFKPVYVHFGPAIDVNAFIAEHDDLDGKEQLHLLTELLSQRIDELIHDGVGVDKE